MDIGRQFTNIIGKHLLLEVQTPIDDVLEKFDAKYGSPGDYDNPDDYVGPPNRAEVHVNRAVLHNMSSHLEHKNGNHEEAVDQMYATGRCLQEAGKALGWGMEDTGLFTYDQKENLKQLKLGKQLFDTGIKVNANADRYRQLLITDTPTEGQ